MGGFLHRLDGSAVGRFAAKLSADSAMTGAIQIAWQAMFSSFPLILGLLGFSAWCCGIRPSASGLRRPWRQCLRARSATSSASLRRPAS